MFIVRSCGDGKGQIPLGSAVARGAKLDVIFVSEIPQTSQFF
jgi:hypothetical protein